MKLRIAAYVKRFNHHTRPVVDHASDGKLNEATMAIRYTRATTEAAKAIHFIYWRSTLPELR